AGLEAEHRARVAVGPGVALVGLVGGVAPQGRALAPTPALLAVAHADDPVVVAVAHDVPDRGDVFEGWERQARVAGRSPELVDGVADPFAGGHRRLITVAVAVARVAVAIPRVAVAITHVAVTITITIPIPVAITHLAA